MRRWNLTTKVYAGLVVLTLATVVVAVRFWDQAWVHEWLPNFIAEWSGLIVAVVIVDRLLSRVRAAEAEARRAPERRLAGERLGLALEPIIVTAVHEYARRHPEEAPEPAADFLERWAPTLAGSPYTREADWVYILANACETAGEALAKFRLEYDSALDSEERAHIADLATTFGRDETDIGHWAEDIDSTFKRVGFRQHIQPLTADEVAQNVANRCTQLAPLFGAVAADYQSLTGQALTTQSGWDSVRITRVSVELLARPSPHPARSDDETPS